jgi:hypothetical protein
MDYERKPTTNTAQPTAAKEKMIPVDGRAQVLDMLRVADPAFREQLLRQLERRDPALARALRREL